MLSELFEFDVKEPWEYPWESEARESLIEEIVQKKYENEITREKVLDVAKKVIKMCRIIGGTPKIREYASRFYGTVDLVCYVNKAKVSSIWYDTNLLGIYSDKGLGSISLPEGFGIDININKGQKSERVTFSNYLKEYFKVENFNGGLNLKEIHIDIYDDHVQFIFR